MATLNRITANLWYASQAQEAANYYTSIFKNSKILRTMYYGKEGFEIHGMPEGTVMTVDFELDGHSFVALNGGPIFKFNESVSFIVNCETQDEIDYYWNKLGEGGDPNAQMCGWLKDKFGLSWQVSPIQLNEMIADSDEEKSARVMHTMLRMKKMDLAALEQAYKG